ncbi:hypothetical protein [uncultured Thiodictyon sp.]|nr:hypothetical protein [uncultured Thiodictyon sp.]
MHRFSDYDNDNDNDNEPARSPDWYPEFRFALRGRSRQSDARLA